MAEEGFVYQRFMDDDDDDKLAMDIESFLSVLDEDRDPSEVRFLLLLLRSNMHSLRQ